jgi:hypothetical protein
MAARVFQREVELFRRHGGGLRMADALRLGINRKTLYAMRDADVVEPVSRGLPPPDPRFLARNMASFRNAG